MVKESSGRKKIIINLVLDAQSINNNCRVKRVEGGVICIVVITRVRQNIVQ